MSDQLEVLKLVAPEDLVLSKLVWMRDSGSEIQRRDVALIVASLPSEVAADPAELRIAVLQRMYWPERNEPLVRSASAALRARSDRRGG